jgi:hypothetical protein
MSAEGHTSTAATLPVAQADVTGLTAALGAKAASVHTHAEADTTSLVADLGTLSTAVAGKAATSHTHAEADTTNLTTDLAAKVPNTRQVLAGTGATGGGALSGDVTVGVAYDTAKPFSVISLGTVGTANKAARSDHRHPGNGWAAVDHGLIGWNFPNYVGGASQILSLAGTLTVWKVPVDEAALAAAGGQITNVVLAVGSVGVTLTSGQNFAGLWLADGTLVALTADQSTPWVSAGVKVMALAGGPYTPVGGAQEVYVGAWFNGSTSPGFVRAGSAPSGLANVGLSTSATFKYATANTGLTTAGANLTTRSASNNMIWAAVS